MRRGPRKTQGAALRQEAFVQVPGGRVWCRIFGRDQGVPLLVIHGGPGLTHDYLEPLNQPGNERPVVFYDQLGAGKSDRPTDVELWRLQRFVEEVGTVRSEFCSGEFHLLGHSWGSMVAIEYALTNPWGLVSLILSSPCLSIERYVADSIRLRDALPPETARVLQHYDRSELKKAHPDYIRALSVYNQFHGCRLDEVPEPIQRSADGRNTRVTETMWGPPSLTPTGSLKNYDSTERLAQIDIPVLLTCGRYDPATPETTAWYASLFSRGELLVLEESSHMAHLKQTEDYLSAVRKFLAQSEAQSRRA